MGIEVIKKFIKNYQVDCDWNESGKYFASSKIEDKKILKNFSNILSHFNYENKFLVNSELKEKLGKNFIMWLFTQKVVYFYILEN